VAREYDIIGFTKNLEEKKQKDGLSLGGVGYQGRLRKYLTKEKLEERKRGDQTTQKKETCRKGKS